MGVIILKKFKIFVSLFTTFALCFTLTLCTSPVSAKSLTVIKPAVRIGHVSKPFWGSGGSYTEQSTTHAHQLIGMKAINILNSDWGTSAASLLNDHMDTFLVYCNKPDEIENDFYTYLGHFYDPDTGKNYLYLSTPTAMSRFKSHADNAKALFLKAQNESDTDTKNQLVDQSFQELGMAVHYLEDMTNSYHADNKIGGLTYHTQYEDYIDSLIESDTDYESFTAVSSNLYNEYSDKNFDAYMQSFGDDSARFAKSYYGMASATTRSYLIITKPDYSKWTLAGEITIKKAEQEVAAFLYRYLQEIDQVS